MIDVVKRLCLWVTFLIGRVKMEGEIKIMGGCIIASIYIFFFTKQAERRIISTRNKNHRKILTNGRVCKFCIIRANNITSI